MPDRRRPRRVVLDDELADRRIVLAQQSPVKLDHSAVADRPVHVHRRVRNVCMSTVMHVAGIGGGVA